MSQSVLWGEKHTDVKPTMSDLSSKAGSSSQASHKLPSAGDRVWEVHWNSNSDDDPATRQVPMGHVFNKRLTQTESGFLKTGGKVPAQSSKSGVKMGFACRSWREETR